MKISKKTIIYMLIALVVAVSVVFVDFFRSYAASSSDFSSNAWKWYDNKGNVISCPDLVYNYDQFISLDYKDLSCNSDYFAGKYKYTVYNVYEEYGSPRATVKFYESDKECVAFLTTKKEFVASNFFKCNGMSIVCNTDDDLLLCIVSNSNIYDEFNYVYCNSGKWTLNTALISGSRYHASEKNLLFLADSNGRYFAYDLYRISSSFNNFCGVSLPDNMKFFSSLEGAYNFFYSGDTSGLTNWNPDNAKEKITYDKDVHFDNFNMDVHASNSLDNYYIDFRYSLPNSLLGKGYCLRIDSTYRREVSNTLTGEAESSKDYTDYQYVTLSDNPFSCRIYLRDFNSVKAGLKDKYNDPFSKYLDFTTDNYNGVYLGLTSLPSIIELANHKVTLSLLNVSCKLYCSGNYGYAYEGSLDILTGVNDIGSYTPDSSGNYKPNNDYRQNGYYYTEVSTDAAENTTYNYYYITNDNSRTEITKDDNDNNSKSGEGVGNNSNSSSSTSGNITNNNSPTFNNNNNITIEGDNINQEVNSYVDGKTSTEDNKSFVEKFLGFFELLENNSFLGVWGKVFGWLPPGISSVITTALGISAGIGLFRFFRR